MSADDINHAQPADSPRNLIAWFAGNHVAATVVMLFLIAAGALTFATLNKETFPTIDPRIIVISVPFPGASPEDVEDGITRRLEEAVIGIQGVERVESRAQEGIGVVNVELEDFADGNQVLTDVETEVDQLINFPPENAEEVRVVKIKPVSSVFTLAIHGELPELTLRNWAEQIEDEILQLPSVALVNLSGTREREIRIEVAEATLRQYQLSIGEIADRISRYSIDLPGGDIVAGNGQITLRVEEKRRVGNQYQDIVIRANNDGSVVRLGDIATIVDGFVDVDLVNEFNGEPAIFLDVNRSAAQNILTIENEVKAYLSTLTLPAGLSVSMWKDETEILRDRMELLARNALLGFGLVFLILLFFLDLRLAFWTSLGIPISFMGGILIASFFGVSINMISLFALIVVLGIVVDDAIVTGESIFAEQETARQHNVAGQSVNSNSTLSGVKAIIAPVTVGVLTTIAAFAPLLFSTGILGQILRPVPIIVIAVLIVSLIEAFFILPAHLNGTARWSLGWLADSRQKVSDTLQRFIHGPLSRWVEAAMQRRYLTLTACVLFIGIALGLVVTGQVRFIFFPQIESDQVRASLEMPAGTPFETTERFARIIEQALNKTEQHFVDQTGERLFRNVSVTIGQASNDAGPPGQASAPTVDPNLAQIDVELVPSAERSVSTTEIERYWRRQVGVIPGARRLAFASSLVDAGEDLNFDLTHRDTQILDQAVIQFMQALNQIDGVTEVAESSQQGKLEYTFRLTPEGLAAGLTPFDLGRQIRDGFFGREALRIQRGRSEMRVMVHYTKQERRSLATLERMRIMLPDGNRVPLMTVANIEQSRNPATIKRVDSRRVVTITGNVDEAVTTPNDVLSQVDQTIMPALAERYPSLNYSLEGQSRDQQQDLASLFRNLLISVMVIFVMLSAQLRSYIKPFIILLTVPLGAAGAIYGHVILGYDLSFISFFGIVALIGVVINDSVVLIDYYNKLTEGRVYDRALDAVKRRFRPILLTTLTTCLGLLPMLLETSLQARFIIPMAISLAMGIVFASAVLVFMLPCLLLVAEDIKQQVQAVRMKITQTGI